MRRKLIKQDAFDQITNGSVAASERELIEAESILAKTLGKDHLSLNSFTESTVLYETRENSFVHAGYEIKNNEITFNNIEELVVDESSRKHKQREHLSEMIDMILTSDDSNNNQSRAKELFQKYLGLVRWDEAKKGFPFKKGKKDKEEGGFPFKKKGKKSKKGHGEKKGFFFGKAKKAGKDLAEAYLASQNVLDYCDFMRVGPTIAEAVVKRDDKQNIVGLKFPTLRERSESKLQRSDWRNLNTKVAEGRRSLADLTDTQDFVKAIANLRRQNAFSNPAGLEEALDYTVENYPNLLFATHSELSQIVAEALDTAGVTSYGDRDCEFMAEAILIRAHDAYKEKVAQILHLASAPKMESGTNPYKFFQHIVEQFYPALDEKFGLERQAFVDLHHGLSAIFKKADRQGDNALKTEAAALANDIAAVLNNEMKAELDLAEEAAEWMSNVFETNLTMGTWNVSNTPHLTVNGDHPDMAKKASHSYSPSKDFSPDWGDVAPAIGQDSMDYKSGKHARTMRNDSWGQEGGKEVFPHIKNPYIPKPFGDWTMKGEKGVDKENKDHSLWKSSDTWPELDNPYVPKEAGGPGGKGYKMKNGKETDLVVDR